MTLSIKTITSVLKAATDIITNIPSRPIGLAEILAIISVSTFKIAVILYLHKTNNNEIESCVTQWIIFAKSY
jgi:hypothetical protein